MLTIIFFACNEEVAVSGITLNQTALTLTLGDTSVLKATVDPENATVQTVTWSAEPAGVVTLKAEGNGCTGDSCRKRNGDCHRLCRNGRSGLHD